MNSEFERTHNSEVSNEFFKLFKLRQKNKSMIFMSKCGDQVKQVHASAAEAKLF